VPSGKNSGWAVVIDPDTRTGDRDNPRPLVMTEERHVRRLSLVDFPTPPTLAGRMRVPKHFNAKEPASRRNLGAALRSRLAEVDLTAPRYRSAGVRPALTEEINELRDRLRRHSCHSCPDREQHARWAERALRLERENERAQARVATRTNTIATHFDKICAVLDSLGYLDADEVTPGGRMLARIYAELDLVAAECIRAGVFDGLSHPQLAAVLASLVYESRRSDDGVRRPRMPDAASEEAMTHVRRIWREVSLVERDARLPRGAEPDIGFSEAAHGWAAGRPLAVVLGEGHLTAGDFVRWVRQVLDFAGQVADAAGPGPLRETAREVVRSMRRGVVAYAPNEDL
jgi:ATP-dependent RNA helicase HelY